MGLTLKSMGMSHSARSPIDSYRVEDFYKQEDRDFLMKRESFDF